ncbi:MAG: V-type ATP synthase subunit A [Planctomycetes bacterium ADurb.Bin412]|nr:MAG: V-type ATP synthase subunit A [Planctomycetes bacterium ADurb.Bin412]
MTVVGEEGTSVDDYLVALKADFFDNCYLQQNAFDAVDAATPAQRQQFVFDKVLTVLELPLEVQEKDQARQLMVKISDLFRNWNYAAQDTEEYQKILEQIDSFIAAKGK